MTSSTDVEIGDDIWITAPQHAWYGKAGKVITKHSGGGVSVGVRINGSTNPVGIYVNDGQFVKVTFHKNWHRKRADCPVKPVLAEEEHFPTSLSDRDRETLEKLREEYGIHDAMGGASSGTCLDCEMYEQHGIHWDSCGNRGRIHMGWCSVEAWQAFRKGWFEEFGEQADFKQEARQRVREAIEKGALFQVEILEGHPPTRRPTENQDNPGVEGVRPWIEDFDKMRPRFRPTDAFTVTKPAIRRNPDYDLPFPVPHAFSVSAQEWADNTVVTRIEALKTTVRILQQEIEMAEKGTVTFKVGGILPERDWNFDTETAQRMRAADEAWHAAEDTLLLDSILEWATRQDWYREEDWKGFRINVNEPWGIRIDHLGLTRGLGLEEREEIVALMKADSK